MKLDSALSTLARMALSAAESHDEKLLVHDAVARLAVFANAHLPSDAAVSALAEHAARAAEQMRNSDRAQLDFRALLQPKP